MAKSSDGFLGKLSGKIGNVVISSWKGIPYLRSKPKRNTSNTPAQKKQRGKFGVVIGFVNRIHPVLNAGFKHNTERMTELNSATSYLMKRAVKMIDGQPALDFSSVLISRGDLPAAINPSAEPVSDGILFRWTFDSGQPGASGDDVLIAMAYDPVHEASYSYTEGDVCRKDEGFTLPVAGLGDGQQLEVYLGFASADGSDACNSTYLGQLQQ